MPLLCSFFLHHVQQGFSCDAAWTEAELWEVWHWDALSPQTESSVVVAASVPCHNLVQLLPLQSSSPRRVQRLWSWDWRPSTERSKWIQAGWKIQYDRRKFRSQTSDNMDRWKAEQGRGREKRKIRREKSRRERVRRKKMQMREKVGKSRNTVFFHWFEAPEGRKAGSLKRRVLAKAAGAEPAGQMRDEKLHAVVARSTYPSQNVQNTRGADHFRSWDVEKVHAVVARSTFPSQNVQNTRGADHFLQLRCRKSARRCGAKHISKSNVENTTFSRHFWKLRCRKSARRCGAKHMSKSKCSKHHMFAPRLEVKMLKKCTPLWREAHFEVKMHKTHHVRTTFEGSDVEKVHAVVGRSTFRSQNVKNTRGSDHFWRFRCRFASLHYTTLHYTPLHYTTLRYTILHNTTTTTTQLHSTTLNYTTLHYTPLHYTILHYTTLHYLPLHFTTLHYTTLQLQLQLHNYTPLH